MICCLFYIKNKDLSVNFFEFVQFLGKIYNNSISFPVLTVKNYVISNKIKLTPI